MTAESREAAADLRAILTELYPYHNYDHTEFDERILGVIVLLRRERSVRKIPPAYAEGAEPSITARAKKKPRTE